MTDNKQETDIQKLQDQLEKQYGPAVAQDIIDRMRKDEKAAAPGYMDVKAMSELQERYRAEAMMAIWRLKEWRKEQAANGAKQNLIQLEGAYLQRQCEDSFKLYRLANKNYFAMYREAMASFTGKIATPTFIHQSEWQAA